MVTLFIRCKIFKADIKPSTGLSAFNNSVVIRPQVRGHYNKVVTRLSLTAMSASLVESAISSHLLSKAMSAVRG